MEKNDIILFALIIPAIIVVILISIRVLLPFSRYAYWYNKNRHWFGLIILCMLFVAGIILFC